MKLCNINRFKKWYSRMKFLLVSRAGRSPYVSNLSDSESRLTFFFVQKQMEQQSTWAAAMQHGHFVAFPAVNWSGLYTRGFTGSPQLEAYNFYICDIPCSDGYGSFGGIFGICDHFPPIIGGVDGTGGEFGQLRAVSRPWPSGDPR